MRARRRTPESIRRSSARRSTAPLAVGPHHNLSGTGRSRLPPLLPSTRSLERASRPCRARTARRTNNPLLQPCCSSQRGIRACRERTRHERSVERDPQSCARRLCPRSVGASAGMGLRGTAHDPADVAADTSMRPVVKASNTSEKVRFVGARGPTAARAPVELLDRRGFERAGSDLSPGRERRRTWATVDLCESSQLMEAGDEQADPDGCWRMLVFGDGDGCLRWRLLFR